MTPAGRPRVSHVITALAEGGAERQLELLVREQGDRAVVVALYDGGPIADALRRDGYDVRVLGMDGWRKATAWPRLALLLRRLRVDVVHVHLLSAQLWGIPAARLAGVRVVVSSEHSLNEAMIEGREHARWLVVLYRILATLATHTIAVSEATRQRLVDWGIPRSEITVVDNGIDFAAMSFDPAGRSRVRAELGIPERTVVVGAVGRLVPSKRFDVLIAALAPTLGPDRTLVVAGDGELREALTRRAADLGVAEHMRFTGARSDMRDLYSAMDVLASPSRDETFGIAVVEGRACGLPVVFATCPAITGLPEPLVGAHLLQPAYGDAELAAIRAGVDAALVQLRAADGDRLGSPDPLVARYAIGGTAAAVDRLYERLLGEASTRRSPAWRVWPGNWQARRRRT